MDLGKPVSQFGLNRGMLLTLLLLNAIISFGKRMKSHSAKFGEHGKCGMTVIMFFNQSYVAVHFMFWLYFTVLWTNPNGIPNILATSLIMTVLFQGQVFICFGCWSTSQVFGSFIREALIFHLFCLLIDISIVLQFHHGGPHPLLLKLAQHSETFVLPIFCSPKCTYNIFRFAVKFFAVIMNIYTV